VEKLTKKGIDIIRHMVPDRLYDGRGRAVSAWSFRAVQPFVDAVAYAVDKGIYVHIWNFYNPRKKLKITGPPE